MNTEKPLASAKSANSPSAEGQFVNAVITRYLSYEGRPIQPVTTVITKPSELENLSSYFPQMGQGKKSAVAGGWIAFATIEFHRKGTPKSLIARVDPSFELWTEGKGDWPLKAGLRDYFRAIEEGKTH
jgi:hypothetical protein